jgi:hypothetical protein
LWVPARSIHCLERTGRRRALYGRLARERRFKCSETFERGVAVGLCGFITGAICAVAGREKLEKRMRLIERYQLRLPRRADQLLAGERRVADQRLQ